MCSHCGGIPGLVSNNSEINKGFGLRKNTPQLVGAGFIPKLPDRYKPVVY